ncbi:Uma2 family endonuclease [Deinococcus koreensis]|uniref:Uma2 family endonuclease n=1 Tax=Deinococcus koreensis TaxID=2054903 RepID=UPI001FAF49AB|nr:Uma2 family endonuclease [Deinococcus koreensis]
MYPLHGQAGASKRHTLIGGNIFGTLYQNARKAGGHLYQNDMKLVVEGSAFVYPDVMLVWEPDDGSPHAETSPCLLVEVLSESTASHDRFGKHGIYTTIPSLQTYLIVEQSERRVYAYGRDGERWVLSDLQGEGHIDLPCLGRRLSLDETYDGVV